MKSKQILILASRSPRRAELLYKADIPFKIHVASIPERTPMDSPHLTPCRLTIYNAALKARSVARKFPDHWVLGADTIVVLGRKILGKPEDLKKAEWMLTQLSGRTHRVITGVYFYHRGIKPRYFTVTTKVTFKQLTQRIIRNYLKQIEPLDKAGAYAAQSHTNQIIRSVDGSFSNIVGLPMEKLTRIWSRLGT